MNVVQEITRIKEAEAKMGIFGGISKASWHDKYRFSAWVYLGGLSYELSEGDIICFMSQWGEVEDINLVREKDTGKSMGFCFVKYEDQRSTILAVDNFNGITLLDRTLRCDHVDKYKLPKEIREKEEEAVEEDPFRQVMIGPGHAYSGKELENDHSIQHGVDLWKKPDGKDGYDKNSKRRDVDEDQYLGSGHHISKKSHKEKKEKKEKKKKKLKDEKHKSHNRHESKRDRDQNPVPANRKSNSHGHADGQGRGFSKFPPSGSGVEAASWRGRYDPNASTVTHSGVAGGLKRPQDNASSSQPAAKKGNFFENTSASFGGMSRRR